MAASSSSSTTSSNTLFIRKLPHDISENALREAYGDVGAIRQCFIVKKKGKLIIAHKCVTVSCTLYLR